MKNSHSAAASMKDVRVLTIMAMLAALSIIFGKVLAFTAGPFRVSFENLPILMAGMFLGAPAGFLVGIIADIIGCLIVGYSINPIITLGAGCIVIGGVELADGITVGAGAVVTKSFLEPGITIAGVPAKKIGGPKAAEAGGQDHAP